VEEEGGGRVDAFYDALVAVLLVYADSLRGLGDPGIDTEAILTVLVGQGYPPTGCW